MNITFKKGTLDKVEDIFGIYQSAIKQMESQGIEQWDAFYPDIDTLKNDIQKEELFIGIICKEIVVVFVINKEQDIEYKNGNWCLDTKDFRVLHRLCVNPMFQNKGIAKITLSYIEECLQKEKIPSIRLDAFSKNPYALRLYQGLGYVAVGEILLRKGKFILMEKLVF